MFGQSEWRLAPCADFLAGAGGAFGGAGLACAECGVEEGVLGAGGAFLISSQLKEDFTFVARGSIIAVVAVGRTGAASLCLLVVKGIFLATDALPLVICDKGRLTLIARAGVIAFSAIFHTSFACSIVTVEKSVVRAWFAFFRRDVEHELILTVEADTLIIALLAIIPTSLTLS